MSAPQRRHTYLVIDLFQVSVGALAAGAPTPCGRNNSSPNEEHGAVRAVHSNCLIAMAPATRISHTAQTHTRTPTFVR